MASWKSTIVKHVDSLADLSAKTIIKALENGDSAVAVFVFKLLYHRSTAWRKRLEFVDDPAEARKAMEQAFTRGDLNTDELAVLIRSRDLQLRIAEHEEMKSRLSGLEMKLDELLTVRGGHDGAQLQIEPTRSESQRAGRRGEERGPGDYHQDILSSA
jgi:hypothetical protein